MLAVILGWLAVVILLSVCVFLIVLPHNPDPVLKSADPEVIKKIPGPRSIPYLGNVLVFNVPRESRLSYVRLEVFTAVTMKKGVFWDVTPCGSCKNRRFGGT
jgi:hypothetical protein